MDLLDWEHQEVGPSTYWAVEKMIHKKSDCFVCRKHLGLENIPGGAIFENELIYISHAQFGENENKHYLGHLFVEPKRHIPQLSDLTRGEAEAIGYFTSIVAKALVETLGLEHVYSFVIGDHVPHVHVHVIGRYPGAPREYWGIKVDEWPDAPQGTFEEIEKASDEIRAYIKLVHGGFNQSRNMDAYDENHEVGNEN